MKHLPELGEERIRTEQRKENGSNLEAAEELTLVHGSQTIPESQLGWA